MEGDEASYYSHRNGELIGGVITHVDDFTIARMEEFIQEILEAIKKELTISKVERDNFCYTGQDILTAEDSIIMIQMEDCVDGAKKSKKSVKLIGLRN